MIQPLELYRSLIWNVEVVIKLIRRGNYFFLKYGNNLRTELLLDPSEIMLQPGAMIAFSK